MRSLRSGIMHWSKYSLVSASISAQTSLATGVSSAWDRAGEPPTVAGREYALCRLPREGLAGVGLVVLDVGRPERLQLLADRVAVGQVAMELGLDVAALPALRQRVLLDLVLQQHDAGE